MHGGKSEPVWTLWDDEQRETSPIKHLALKQSELPVYSKHVG